MLKVAAAQSSGLVNVWRFPFNQNVRFEFSATSTSEWNSIFQNFQKRGQPRDVDPKFRKKNFKEVFFPFMINFALRIWRIRRISKIQQLSGFLQLFVRNFCTICRCFQIFPKFWLNGKRPLSPHVKPVFRVRASNYDWAHCTKRTAIRPGFETFQMMNGNIHGLAEHLTFQRSGFAFAILFSRERNLLYTRINCNCGPYLSWPSLELAIKFRHKRLSCLDGLLCLV